jgi:hypothetical protein
VRLVRSKLCEILDAATGNPKTPLRIAAAFQADGRVSPGLPRHIRVQPYKIGTVDSDPVIFKTTGKNSPDVGRAHPVRGIGVIDADNHAYYLLS